VGLSGGRTRAVCAAASLASTQNRHGKIVLLNPTKKADDLVQLSRLVSLFRVFNDESEAVEAATAPAVATV